LLQPARRANLRDGGDGISSQQGNGRSWND
jgi:hypothetical protein